jgi:hypothetical protein
MKKLKKQITLVTFNRFFNPSTYLICSSTILSKQHTFISNYALKYLYLYVLPKNFLNCLILNHKILEYINNFIGLLQFKNKKDIYFYYMSLEVLDKLKIGFIKYKNLYLVCHNSVIKYLNIYFLVRELRFTVLNYNYKFYMMIKQIQ